MKSKLYGGKWLGVLMVLAATTVCGAENPPAKSDWNVTDHVPFEKFILQSHRGAGVLAPENTIEAFELGWKLNTYPESDIRTTTDGVIVAFHDANFKRVVKGADAELQKKGVETVTFAELSKLDVGAWQGDHFTGRHVSRIKEVFALMTGKPERHLYLDIKKVDLKQLADEVNSSKVSAQVVLASTKPEVIREWKKYVPQSDTLHWMGGEEKVLRERVEKLKAENFAGITQLQIHIYLNKDKTSPNPFTLSNDFILELGKELRARNILYQALPWTDDKTVFAKLMDLGVASFATDYPDATLKEIKAYYDQRRAKK